MSVTVTGDGPSIALTGTGSAITITVTTGSSSGGGVTDHGALTGLADDDHTQYAQKANNLSDLTSAATARTNLGLGSAATSAAGDFAAASHTHAASDITSGAFDAARLATGTATDGYVIASDNGTPTWTAPAGGGGLWTTVADTTLGSATAQVDIDVAAVGTFAMLRIQFIGSCSDTGANLQELLLRLNNDATANRHIYSRSWGSPGTSSYWRLGQISGALTNTWAMAQVETTISHLSGKYPQMHSYASRTASNSTTQSDEVRCMGVYELDASVADLSFIVGGGSNFVAGSRFIVEGIA